MRAGELAARLRANAEAVKKHKAFTREWKDAVKIQRSALFTNLPLILAALDVAEWADRMALHDPLCEVHRTKACFVRDWDCDCGLNERLGALRRAEEAAP